MLLDLMSNHTLLLRVEQDNMRLANARVDASRNINILNNGRLPESTVLTY